MTASWKRMIARWLATPRARDARVRLGLDALEGRLVPALVVTPSADLAAAMTRFTDFTVGGRPTAVLTADFNADGTPDVAVTSEGGLDVSLGNGDGTFTPSFHLNPLVTGGLSVWPNGAAAGDLDGDGNLDLVLTTAQANREYVLLGNGDGTFRDVTPPASTVVYAGHGADGVVLADFNGDGRLDQADSISDSGSPTGPGLSVSLGIPGWPGWGFGTPTGYTLPQPGGRDVVVAPDQNQVAADFNHDGFADLAVTSYPSTGGAVYGPGYVSILLGNGNGTFRTPIDYAVGDRPLALALGDFDNNGHADLVIVNGNDDAAGNKVTVLFGVGDGTFRGPNLAAPDQFDSHPVGESPRGVVVADLDGDGNADLVTANYSDNTLSFLRGHGNGTFDPAAHIEAGSAGTQVYPKGPIALAAADVNRDGSPDLLVANRNTSAVTVFLNRPFRSAQTISFNPLANQTFGGPDVLLGATASSGLPVTYTVSGSGVLVQQGGNSYVHVTGVGPVTVTADQAGSAAFYPAAAVTRSFTVAPAAAVVTLGGLTATYDGAAHAATVSTAPPGLPVSVTYNGSPTPPTAAGAYAVVAAVTDPNYLGTGTGTLTIAAASTTVGLTASDAAPLAGVDGLTLTAAVGVVAPGAGTPTGSVTFYDGATPLGTVNLVNGVATLPLGPAVLAAGAHELRAVYLGTTNFAGGTSGTVAVTVIAPSAVQGLVYVDFNDDGQVDFGEKALPGVTVTLTGTDDRGATVSRAVQTDANGVYVFIDLRPSGPNGYTITETQPPGYAEGTLSVGTVNGVPVGSAGPDRFAGVVMAAPGSTAENYNFAERPLAGGAVSGGQTATIGFWQNTNGQALVQSLNGGPTSHQLGDWLAATFPNLYATLAGKTNAEVASYYKGLFGRTAQTAPAGPPKTDAQVMATALAVYVTNSTLGGSAGTAYGFAVSDYGVGARTFGVGSDGAAFGLANNARATVLDLLLAVDARSSNGLAYDLNGNGLISSAEAAFRTMANDVFDGINEAGDI
jgi:hypothetical protein